jgi:hypothetical protein
MIGDQVSLSDWFVRRNEHIWPIEPPWENHDGKLDKARLDNTPVSRSRSKSEIERDFMVRKRTALAKDSTN